MGGARVRATSYFWEEKLFRVILRVSLKSLSENWVQSFSVYSTCSTGISKVKVGPGH